MPTHDGFEPFNDDAASRSIGGLTFENGTTKIVAYGSVEMTRDKRGLADARRLRDAAQAIIDVLSDEPDLPDQVAEPSGVHGTSPNPFGHA